MLEFGFKRCERIVRTLFGFGGDGAELGERRTVFTDHGVNFRGCGASGSAAVFNDFARVQCIFEFGFAHRKHRVGLGKFLFDFFAVDRLHLGVGKVERKHVVGAGPRHHAARHVVPMRNGSP